MTELQHDPEPLAVRVIVDMCTGSDLEDHLLELAARVKTRAEGPLTVGRRRFTKVLLGRDRVLTSCALLSEVLLLAPTLTSVAG